MKKFSKVLGVLGVAALAFTACDNQGNTNSTAPSATTADSEVSIADMKVAYIHTDSVINNFEFFKERSAEIADKGKKYESELSNRAKGFEQEVANFQQSANSMTMNQARAKEEELVKKERNLVSYRDNLMQELSADESKLYNDVYDRIQAYLNTYAEENNLEMILSYTRGGGVWYAKGNLDVTNSVIEGINSNYNATKSTAEKK
ncbi:OmpH family outer membrane protein [Anditalea andensis]|uniref:Outer membrane chaperone Skp n=1 Tax=Anditalea andensis TaxID=1048983 RepID=A0A074L0S1_9BACT|nr:OmpH family outer membrane protein [Anditalea andensis]KEO74060.1 outer membrane chaperone Skp [Anditalea andensis]